MIIAGKMCYNLVQYWYMSIQEFIKKRENLIWYVGDKDNLSEDSIVESVLNYGNCKDFKGMINIMSIEKVADIFRKQLERERNNYRPSIKNYFTLYFNKYASITSK
jgi:hypothetical protein